MINFLETLLYRNGALFFFGCCNFVIAFGCLLTAMRSRVIVRGANAWLKPFKFGLSIGIFSWTMGWYTYLLHLPGSVNLYNWVVIIFLGFEIVYITLQAARGQLSHYNISTPTYSFLTIFMGIAAAIVTLWTGYIGFLFLATDFTDLPDYYVLSIRMAIFLFVFFAFQGAAMGARQQHTVGGEDGGQGLPVVNWSTRHGDLRIAHFIGMHGLQILPLLSSYFFKNTIATAIAGFLYAMLAVFALARASQGKTLVRQSIVNNDFLQE